MISTTFTIDLNQAVLHSLATISKFDGTSPSMACGTVGGKIFMHSPHQASSTLTYLNINKTIICLASGKLSDTSKNEVLLIGSTSSLLAYDVHENTDIFNSDVRDGVYSMCLGKVDVSGVPTKVVLVGGNCSILGYDSTGSDVFWTVSGDNVSAIEFFMTEKNERRILVGSEDYAIRIFNNEEMLFEINETAKVTGFCEMGVGKYGYSLDNGCVGIYKGTHRMWKAKAKHKVTSLVCSDISGEGVPSLVLGWSNGKLELRSERKGEELFKKALKQPISKVMYEDYRMEGKKQIIAVTNNGKIVGFSKDSQLPPQTEEVEDLNKQKTLLLNEIQSLKDQRQSSVIPNYTTLNVSFQTNPTCIVLSSNNSTYIKCVILLSEGLFENDLKFFHAAKPASEIKVPLNNSKFLDCEIEIKALIGATPSAVQFQLYERKVKLPKYCNFHLTSCPAPSGQVVFQLSFVPKLQDWIKSKFLVNEQELGKITDSKFCFTSNTENLHLLQTENKLKVLTESIDLAGEIIQDLAGFYGITELSSSANFAQDLNKIKDLLEKIEDYNTVRTQLTVNMAESCQNVKALIVKAEDARIQKNMTYFKQNLSALHQFNGQLLGEYQIRTNNHTELLSCLKVVNQYIQKAGNLRCGQAKNKTISMFREGVKSRNFNIISQAICEDFGIQGLYLASAIALTWLKPIQYSLTSQPADYKIWIEYWVVLSLVTLIENSFLQDFSSNFGYYFIRTLFFFYMTERKFINSEFNTDYTSFTMTRIGNQKDFKVLNSMLTDDSDINAKNKLHPWAPNPTSIRGMAVCRIGELSQDSLNIEDQQFIAENTLEKIVEMLESPEEALSINAMLALMFLSEKELIKNKMVTLEIFERMEALVKNRTKQVSQSALRLCANLYFFNKELQIKFIKLKYHSFLIANMRENDPLIAVESFNSLFWLISTPQGDIYVNFVKALLGDGLRDAIEEVDQKHGKRKEFQERIDTLKTILNSI